MSLDERPTHLAKRPTVEGRGVVHHWHHRPGVGRWWSASPAVLDAWPQPLVDRSGFAEYGTPAFEQRDSLVVEGVEPIDDGLSGPVEHLAFDPRMPGRHPGRAPRVGVDPARRRRQRTVGSSPIPGLGLGLGPAATARRSIAVLGELGELSGLGEFGGFIAGRHRYLQRSTLIPGSTVHVNDSLKRRAHRSDSAGAAVNPTPAWIPTSDFPTSDSSTSDIRDPRSEILHLTPTSPIPPHPAAPTGAVESISIRPLQWGQWG